MTRYEWRKPLDSPHRFELIDQTTKLPIGVILNLGRKWHWQRKTSPLLHGVPPAEGLGGQLTEAKNKLLDGLPD